MKGAFISGLLAMIACWPLNAQWERLVFSGKGASVDIPSAHPLSYFTANPVLRDDGHDLCASCAPEGMQKYVIRSVVKPVGSLAGYSIVDVLYYIGERADDAPKRAKWKFILVEVAPEQYKEIFHLQALYTVVSLTASRIAQSGSEKVLATVDNGGGNGDGCWEGYWWFDRAGPHNLDFSRLKSEIKRKVPQNTVFSLGCEHLNLEAERIDSGVQKIDAPCHACGLVGQVTAHFHLVGAKAEPGTISYKPAQP